MRRGGRALAALGCALLAGCPLPGAGPDCAVVSEGRELPEGLEESSGVAASRAHPGVFWTHGDGSEPLLWAVDAEGAEVGRVRLEGASLTDWEDVALAACGEGDCLYLADTGDNVEQRDFVRVLRLSEPDPRGVSVATVESFELRLPDGPRDVESLFVLPEGRVHLVSKGVNHPVSVYRIPGGLAAGEAAVLEEVQRLGGESRSLPRQVTGASASPDGARVAVRTYETVVLYAVEGDTLAEIEDGTLNLRTLREGQGEGVALAGDGLIVLTSEAGPLGGRGSIALARCEG